MSRYVFLTLAILTMPIPALAAGEQVGPVIFTEPGAGGGGVSFGGGSNAPIVSLNNDAWRTSIEGPDWGPSGMGGGGLFSGGFGGGGGGAPYIDWSNFQSPANNYNTFQAKQGLDEYVQLVEEEKLVDVTTKQAEEKADVFTDLGMRPTKPAFDQGAVNNFVLSGGGYSFPSIPDYSGGAFTENFDKRWNQEVSDLEKVHAPIPYEKLHARALEILRERSAQLPVVAKDEENGQ